MMHIWISCKIKSMKWNLVKSFTIFIGVGARTLARSPEQYNQKTHSVSSNQWQWSSVADLIVTHLSLPFTLSVVLALPICKIGRRIKYANGTQSLPKSIFLYLDKLWQIILISFHENCALAAIRCCRCSFNLFFSALLFCHWTIYKTDFIAR